MFVMTWHPAVLVTGMSGVGKSTVLAELARRGYTAVDTDDEGWIEVIEGEPLWRELLIKKLLDRPRDRPLVVQGTVANQGRFYDRFDAIVLLSAPIDVVLRRIGERSNNPFGKSAHERAHIVADIAEVEPLLRQAATHEISTDRPLAEVVDIVADTVGGDFAQCKSGGQPDEPDPRSRRLRASRTNIVGIAGVRAGRASTRRGADPRRRRTSRRGRLGSALR